MTSAGKLFVRRRGKDVTLRTFALGAKDAEYGIEAVTETEATIRAVFAEFPRETRRRGGESGEEFPVTSAIFHVADGDEPALSDGDRAPEIDCDGDTYRVKDIRPVRGGQRALLCEKAR